MTLEDLNQSCEVLLSKILEANVSGKYSLIGSSFSIQSEIKIGVLEGQIQLNRYFLLNPISSM